jgi:hypothetical protein
VWKVSGTRDLAWSGSRAISRKESNPEHLEAICTVQYKHSGLPPSKFSGSPAPLAVTAIQRRRRRRRRA